MKVTWTIHRALSELKMYDKKIKNAIKTLEVVGIIQKNKEGRDTSIDKEKKAEYRKSFDKVQSLIRNQEKIKWAVVKANSKNTIEINGKTMTVANAITRKHLIETDKSLLFRLKDLYAHATRDVERSNEIIRSNSKQLAQNLAGNQNSEKIESEYITKATTAYEKENLCSLFDPINIKKAIEKLSDEIETFEAEIDGVLSTSNALKTIELDLSGN